MTELRGPFRGANSSPDPDDPITSPPSERVRTIDVTGPPAVAAVSASRPDDRVRPHARRGFGAWMLWTLRLGFVIAAGYALLVLALIMLFRFVDPPTSAFMLGQRLTGEPIDRIPVPLGQISPHLVRAVIVSEDSRFCRHRGVDWGALAEAIDDTRAGFARGGSTIAMQTAKNLFLWSSRSYIRKAMEIPLALTIDALWPKRRVLEVYLNLAEWGPGIFGAEAAAQYHFRKSAAELSESEAALLAASLPSPLSRDAGEPGEQTARLAARLERRMAGAKSVATCID